MVISKNGSIQGRLIDEIRRRIIAGEISPGVNISELAIAEEFGVSRTPVRETFKQLQTEGLVEIRPKVGTFVTTPSRREITELFEMKELLEGAAARLLAQRGRVPEVDLLEENLRQADLAVAADDKARYAELVEEFHNLLITGADNSKLVKTPAKSDWQNLSRQCEGIWKNRSVDQTATSKPLM